MQSVKCEVSTIINDEEVQLGFIDIFNIPRKDEILWFSKELKGETSWTVVDVCHHVGNGELNSCPLGYQSIVLYVKPTVYKEWDN